MKGVLKEIKKDKLNRVIYEKYNDSIRYVTKYYGNTDKKKIIIKLVNNQQIIGIFTKSGRTIFTSDNSNFFDLETIKVYKKNIEIKLPIDIRNEYLNILRSLKNKSRKK